MKKSTIIGMVALAMLSVSCSSSDEFAGNNTETNKAGNVKVTLNASMPSTRTVLTDGGTGGMTQTWAATDAIKVVNAGKSFEAQTFSTTGSGTSKTASFTGSLTNPSQGDQLYAFYPSDLVAPAGVGTPTAASVSVNYSTQDGTLAGAASKAVMYAGGTYNSSGSTNLGTFINAGSILRIKMTFPVDVTVSKVELMANGLKNGGTLQVTGSGTNVLPTWTDLNQGSMTANLSPELATSSNALTVYMASLPLTGLKGITLFATTKTGEVYSEQLAATGVNFNANSVYTLNPPVMTTEIIYTGQESSLGKEPIDIDEDGKLEMMTAENFKWLQADANLVLSGETNATTGKTFRMVKNMTVNNGVSWIPLGGDSQMNSFFMGTFDGNGKVVKNVAYSGNGYFDYGFFGRIFGATIMNLEVKGSGIVSTYPSGYVGALVGHATGYPNACVIKNCSTTFTSVTATDGQVGGLVGTAENNNYPVKILGCRSNITALSGWTAGGIVGYCGSGNSIVLMTCISNCSTISASRTSGEVNAGGLIGKSIATINEVKGCLSNCASINASSSGQVNKGALFGNVAAIENNYSNTNINYCYWDSTTGVPATATGNIPISLTNVNSVSGISGFNGVIGTLNNNFQSLSGYKFEEVDNSTLPNIKKAPLD